MNKLKEVVNFLNTKNISISEEHDDGRINSVVDEKTIINILKEEYGSENIIEPPARHWWDVKVFGFPINIKVSAFNSADNFSAKGAVLYSLTNLSENDITKIKSWSDFQEKLLLGKYKDNNRDYYCIVLNKQTNEVILQGLKTLTKLTPNGNNLLFQINWNNNQTIVNRTHEDAYNFLVGAYKESVKKKVSVHAGYETL
jgi:hypothetical protein|tara:strand:+ start:190 stop:786 length:597 start_codon:yes stop_codon:yes gene_type:complete